MFKDKPFTVNHSSIWINVDADFVCKSFTFLAVINELVSFSNNTGFELVFST